MRNEEFQYRVGTTAIVIRGNIVVRRPYVQTSIDGFAAGQDGQTEDQEENPMWFALAHDPHVYRKGYA